MKSMLVVEGDGAVARLFKEVFSQRNWNVEAPPNGEGLIEALVGGSRYDIILISYRVPALNGAEIVRLIGGLERHKNTPVLMVTGNGDVNDEALAAGAKGVLQKPIELDRLVAAVAAQTPGQYEPD